MKRNTKLLVILALACLMIPGQVNAQKRKTQTRRSTTSRMVTYPQRDADFLSNYRLPSIGEFNPDNNGYGYNYVTLPTPYFDGHVLKRDMSRKQVTLRQVSCTQNDITDTEEWFRNNGLEETAIRYENEAMDEMRPRFRYESEIYHAIAYGVHYGNTMRVAITDDGQQTLYGAYNFDNFQYPPKARSGADHTLQYIKIEGNIMYVAHTGNGYAKAFQGQTGYISAIDMRTNEILWTTEPLTCNSSFEIVGNSIICGYGFSDEPDYLFVVDKYSGQRVQKIFLKKGPQYVVVKGNRVYVRTYSYDYVFSF